MFKKKISFLIFISLILTSFSSCTSKVETNATSETNVSEQYYSITTRNAYHENNYYMDVDVKIPKITYSGNEQDELFDSINDEIYNNLSELILDAENNAKTTYDEYLETAKNNYKNDFKHNLSSLKTKYKSILSDEDIYMINTLIASVSEMSVDDESRKPPRKSTDSKLPPRMKPNDNKVFGHTNAEDLIIPGLHNKNIIIVETTSATETESQSTISIEGRPKSLDNFAPVEGESYPNKNNERGERHKSSKSNIDTTETAITSETNHSTEITNDHESLDENKNEEPDLNESKNNNKNKNSITTKANIETEETEYIDNVSSKSDIENNLTMEDFYSELIDIIYSKAPTNIELARLYTPTEIKCNFDVKCLDEDYLSLFIELTETKTVTRVTRFFYNIDLHEKKIVKINDVLGDNFKETCINSINAAIDNFSDEEKSKLRQNYNLEDYINENTLFFINNNHRPVIELDKWAITNDYLEFQIMK